MKGAGFTFVMLAALLPSAGAAQIPDLPTIGRNWTDVSYPKVYYTSRDRLTVGLYYAQVRPKRFADFYTPPPYLALLGIDGEVSTSGSWSLALRSHLPALVNGWRFTAVAEIQRRAREPYFGLGNETEWVRDSVTDQQPHFYQADIKSQGIRLEAQRRVAGPVRALAGLQLHRWRYDTLAGPSLLARDAAGGAATPLGAFTTEGVGRVGLVVDTRDDEVAPRRGVHLQAILAAADSNLMGSLSFRRFTISAAGYVRALPRVTLAARTLGQSVSGSPGLGTLEFTEQSERPFAGFGGQFSHRGLTDRRFLGEDQILANVDIRWEIFEAPTLYRVTILGFVDAGRVFYNESFRITTEDLHVGGGGGLFLHFFQAAVVGGTLGFGPDGAVLQFYTRWTY